MTSQEALKKIIDELVQKHHCHTIIQQDFYQPDSRPGAFFNLYAFREGGEPLRDMQAIGDEEHTFSLFIHPEAAAKSNPADFLEISEGKVLLEKGTFAQDLIKETQKLWLEGPDRLPDQEIKEMKAMILQVYDKMSKLNTGDRQRMEWLHKGLIEFYFLFRRLWYLDHKYGYKWLEKNDPQSYDIFMKAQRHTDPKTMNENFKLFTDIVIAGEQK